MCIDNNVKVCGWNDWSVVRLQVCSVIMTGRREAIVRWTRVVVPYINSQLVYCTWTWASRVVVALWLILKTLVTLSYHCDHSTLMSVASSRYWTVKHTLTAMANHTLWSRQLWFDLIRWQCDQMVVCLGVSGWSMCVGGSVHCATRQLLSEWSVSLRW